MSETTDTRRAWHTLPAEETVRLLESRHAGLSAGEAAERFEKFGPNRLKGKKKTPAAVVFFRQFLSPLVYILVTAAVVKTIVGSYADAVVIGAVLLLMALIGFVQEIRAEKAMQALLQMVSPRAKVRRGGKLETISAPEIVPGDIIVLEAGDKIPADVRLLESSNLSVNEAALTGESVPSEKDAAPVDENAPVTDRRNMAYLGTTVAGGRAVCIVTATGMSTEIGRIATAISEVRPQKTPLQKSIDGLGHSIILIVLAACVFLVAAGVLRRLDLIDIFLLAVAAAVSAIPEGLPGVVTVLLAIGMRSMAKRNAIVRKMVAVETLGSATVICSDKTGTLTMNQMTVRRVFCDGGWYDVSGEGYRPDGSFARDGRDADPATSPVLTELLRSGVLCNDALYEDREPYDIIGDPTEGALLVAAEKAGMKKQDLETKYSRIAEIPFQSEKQYMATLHEFGAGKRIFVKGSPERMLELCSSRLAASGPVPLDESAHAAIQEANTAMARDALRVIAFGYAETNKENASLKEDDIRGRAVLIGLMGMIDPPREDARQAVELCRQAGIRVAMITGDNPLTAAAIGRNWDCRKGGR